MARFRLPEQDVQILLRRDCVIIALFVERQSNGRMVSLGCAAVRALGAAGDERERGGGIGCGVR
jgi:hypothetical protein